MSLLKGDVQSTGYMVLPSGIGFTREQAAVMAALHMFPGWPPMIDALRHLAVQAQERMMSRYTSNEDSQYERGYITALEEVADLVGSVIPSAYATLLAKEEGGNERSEAGGERT